MSSPFNYQIQIATEADREDVLNFLRRFFFRDEPLNCSLKLYTDEWPTCEHLESFAVKCLEENVSLKAVRDGKIIGVAINGILERGWLDEEDFQCDDERFSIILGLLEHVARESDPFKAFPDSDKAITVKIVSVDSECRGQGIAKELMAKVRDLGKEHGCGFMTVDCTSHFTACALKRLGFDLHYTLKYSDYKVDGKVVLKPELPHEAATVYTQRIN